MPVELIVLGGRPPLSPGIDLADDDHGPLALLRNPRTGVRGSEDVRWSVHTPWNPRTGVRGSEDALWTVPAAGQPSCKLASLAATDES